MVFISRKRCGPDRWLKLKVALLGLAAAAFLLAVRLERRWLVWVAVGLVLVGFLLRFAPANARDGGARPPTKS
jgi:hypothetical protein